ncbi:NAD(P)-binding protein, partial [Caulochytrium protostelioides]
MVAVLVLGGVGFIGRTLVDYLVRSDRASYIRVVDKGLPATAYLAPAIKASFEDPRVEFRQANIGSPAGLLRAFSNEGCAPLDGKEFDIVYNLAAETKYGQTDEVYDEKVYQISVNAGQAAAARKIPVFVEVSTAQVYDGDKKAATESSKTKPWTLIAKHKLRAEEALKAIPGLNLVIVRPSIVYGPGDVLGITPRLIVAAVYKQLQEDMKMLWTKDIRINTVHVTDVARALW